MLRIGARGIHKALVYPGKLDAYHSVGAGYAGYENLSLDKIKLRKPQGSELESITLISEAVSPDEQLEQKDAAECIRRLIAQLPTLQQTIIRMKRYRRL